MTITCYRCNSPVTADGCGCGDGISLVHGDCREVLPQLPPVDLVLTDPPYLNLTGGYSRKDDRLGKRISPSVALGNEWSASIEWIAPAKEVAKFGAAVFCTHHGLVETAIAFDRWRRAVLLTWHKPNAAPTGANVPRFTEEHIWGFAKRPGLKWDGFKATLIIEPTLAAGCCANHERILSADGKAAHPTQKPLKVVAWVINSLGAESVIDPFCGSGTTLVAAKQLGRRAIGVEIELKYVEIAAARLRQEILQFTD